MVLWKKSKGTHLSMNLLSHLNHNYDAKSLRKFESLVLKTNLDSLIVSLAKYLLLKF